MSAARKSQTLTETTSEKVSTSRNAGQHESPTETNGGSKCELATATTSLTTTTATATTTTDTTTTTTIENDMISNASTSNSSANVSTPALVVDDPVRAIATSPTPSDVDAAEKPSSQADNSSKREDSKYLTTRVTRNSPLLLSSPNSKKEAVEMPELQQNNDNSESEEVPASTAGSTASSVAASPSITTSPSAANKRLYIRGRKSLKDIREQQAQTQTPDNKPEAKVELTEVKNPSDTKESKESKDLKENISKDVTSAKETSQTNPTTIAVTTSASATVSHSLVTVNRTTRKSLSMEVTSNTRVTRQRNSCGAAVTRSEMSPSNSNARATKSRPVGRPKLSSNINDSTSTNSAISTKRKHSCDVVDEISPRRIKIETKDAALDNDELANASSLVNSDGLLYDVKVKAEIPDLESENESEHPTSVTTQTAAVSGRMRGRMRKANSVYSLSPSTRATRQSKGTSPAPNTTTNSTCASEPKRKRLTPNSGNSRSLLKSNVGLNSKTVSASNQDEDSKDRSVSPNNTEDAANKTDLENGSLADDLDQPLTIDTEVDMVTESDNPLIAAASEDLTTSAASEKAASLSPPVVCSEGVSEISVKQFYKKPKFLENNLGIEEDPQLGEIIADSSTSIIPEDNSSNASLKDAQLDTQMEENYETSKVKSKAKPVSPPPEQVEEIDTISNHSNEQLVLNDNGEGSTTIHHINLINMEIYQEQEDDDDDDDVDQLTIDEGESISMENNASANEELETPPNANEDIEGDIQDNNSVEADVKTESTKILPAAKETKAVEMVKMRQSRRLSQRSSLGKETSASRLSTDLSQQAPNKDLKEIKVGRDADDEEDEKDIVDNIEEENITDVKVKFEIIKTSSDSDPLLVNNTHKKERKSSNSDINLNAASLKSSAKDEDALSIKSNNSSEAAFSPARETNKDDDLKQKEQHLQHLGLLTHKAAEKRRQEVMQSSAAAIAVAATTHQHTQSTNQQQATYSKRSNKHTMSALAPSTATSSSLNASTPTEYTGTLKTVIKLNRNASVNGGNSGSAAGVGCSGNGGGRKGAQNNTSSGSSSITVMRAGQHTHQNRRQSLKMTFQKGRGRAHGVAHNERHQNDREHHAEDNYYTIQNENEDNTENQSMNVLSKKDEKEEILIPEKASSFKFHPDRLCEDQCFYCSGKFGLYDTPCHVGQIKSMERQQKILANEEKLTVDNCLCDACFRHVDRRANVPSYKKRLSAPGNLEAKSNDNQSLEDHNDTDSADVAVSHNANNRHKCVVTDCSKPGVHSLRRKCIRKSVKKFLLNFELPTGSLCIWLCRDHYDTVIQSTGCVLCKRRLGKNHMYHITSDTDRLEKSLAEMGIPVQLGIGTAVCKLCRYFANLLMKPLDNSKSQKAEFVKNYRKRLLQFHNIHDGSNEASEMDEDDSNSGPNDTSAIIPAHHQLHKSPALDDAAVTENSFTTSKDSSSNSIEALRNSSLLNSDSSGNSNGNVGPLLESANTEDADANYEAGLAISADSSNASSKPANSKAASPSVEVQQQMSKLKAILQSNSIAKDAATADISTVLRANPNISMRELFPGEEDLGLSFKAPFGSSNCQRTPEGWTRVQTFLQYDEPTRRLWEELQKPYGNQSSFLRHLILLEKYYRNGDLILSANASSNASVYTETVRQRLISYDHGHCGGLRDNIETKTNNTSDKLLPMNKISISTTAAAAQDEIPTVEITEDDDEDVNNRNNNESDKTNNNDDDDDDVIVTSPVIEMIDLENCSSTDSPSESAGPSPCNATKPKRSRSSSVDKLAKQLNSNAVTIIARPKDHYQQKITIASSLQKSLLKDNNYSANQANNVMNSTATSATTVAQPVNTSTSTGGQANGNSRSILKCNLLGINKSVEILPINTSGALLNASYKTQNVPAVAGVETKQQKILEVANKLLGNQLEANAQSKMNTSAPAKLLTSPPELVSLQRRSSYNNAAASSSNANANLPATVTSNAAQNTRRPQMMGKAGSSGSTRPSINVVILPDTLTPQERLQSKSWRPTLMPVEENQNLFCKGGPLYQTADGRRLPNLVQVQSGGKPFLISIFDYNRMCILRREKLMRDQMLKTAKKRPDGKQQNPNQLQKSNTQDSNKNASTSRQQQLQQLHQQQHVQLQQPHLQQVAQQKFLQLLQQQALMKAVSTAVAANTNTVTPRFQGITAKAGAPTSNATIVNVPSMQNAVGGNSNFASPMMPLLANAISNASNTNANNNSTATVATSNNTLTNASWLWNNFPDASQLLNGATAASNTSSAGTTITKLPPLIAKLSTAINTPANSNQNINTSKQLQQLQQQLQQQQQQIILSKIPKSLTVIPQHKLMNAAAAAAAAVNANTNATSSTKNASVKE